MRSGRLLAEDSPLNLLKIHSCLSLEDVFLKLCMKDKTVTNNLLPPSQLPNNNAASKNSSLNIISVYNDKNRHHAEGVVIPEENGIVGLAFHQSKDNLMSSDNKLTSSNKDLVLQPDPIYNRVNQLAEDCVDCCSKPNCSFRPFESLNRLRALIIKNFICMWRNIG